jgi:hypothetical protein
LLISNHTSPRHCIEFRTPKLLGLAVENGALLRTSNGTSVTFRTNPAGLVTALVKHNFLASNPAEQEGLVRGLSRFSAAFTFDTSRGPDPKQLLANYRQLAEVSGRFDLINRRDPRHPSWFPVWQQFAAAEPGSALAKSVEQLSELLDDDAYSNLIERTADELVDPNRSDTQAVLIKHFAQVAAMLPKAEMAHVVDLYVDYLKSQRSVYDNIANSPILTIEYALNRSPFATSVDPNASGIAANPTSVGPDLSTIRLIYGQRFAGRSELTANVSMSMFNQLRAGMRGNIRDYQAGAKLDIPLPRLQNIGSGILTFSGLYSRLRQQPLGVPLQINGVNVDNTGNIGIFQAKLTIPMGSSGLQIPLSFSYANRTELILEKDVRAHIGITFDLDKLFARP